MGEESRLRAVAELSQSMAAAHGMAEVAHAAASRARQALDGSFAAISVWERERGRLRVLANVGALAPDEEEFPADESYPVHDFPEIALLAEARGEPAAWVTTAGEPAVGAGGAGDRQRAVALRRRGRGCCVVAPIVLQGPAWDELYRARAEDAEAVPQGPARGELYVARGRDAEGIETFGRREAGVPQGPAWGELYVARGRGAEVFGRRETDFAAVLASVIAAGLVQHQRLEEVRRLAFTDPLTGLANRRAVDLRLDEAVAQHRAAGTVVTLVVCDVNGLKQVNDTYGHAAGDRLLERFGSVLSLCGAALPGSLAARLGGDEFCLLAVGQPTEEVVRAAAEVCRRADALELGHGVACGVASTGERIGEPAGVRLSARRLFRLADAAQYQAKAARSREPVVAGRAGPHDEVVALADAAGPPPAEGDDRRRFRGRGTPRHRVREDC
ncbi:GGDEF domain-containing protein [Streptomyces sp. B6B3]|uniref:GGDEF domain-containing protein n=1 Tax=Streptomyces sp. B6B3 TaxID=3153570 RepID=UPI00325D987B